MASVVANKLEQVNTGRLGCRNGFPPAIPESCIAETYGGNGLAVDRFFDKKSLTEQTYRR
jgi:hypothetical protein